MSATPQSIGQKTVAAAGTPVQLSATHVTCKRIIVNPIKSAAPVVANTGAIYLMSAAGARATATYVIPAASGPQTIDRPPSSGEQFDLFDWWLDADTNGDGALIGYLGE